MIQIVVHIYGVCNSTHVCCIRLFGFSTVFCVFYDHWRLNTDRNQILNFKQSNMCCMLLKVWLDHLSFRLNFEGSCSLCFSCVGVDEDEAPDIDVYHCPNCEETHGKSTCEYMSARGQQLRYVSIPTPPSLFLHRTSTSWCFFIHWLVHSFLEWCCIHSSCSFVFYLYVLLNNWRDEMEQHRKNPLFCRTDNFPHCAIISRCTFLFLCFYFCCCYSVLLNVLCNGVCCT